MKYLIRSFALLAIVLLASCNRDTIHLASPNGTVKANVYLSAEGAPCIDVRYDGKEVVRITNIGYTSADTLNLADGFTLVDTQSFASINDTLRLAWGENKSIPRRASSYLLSYCNTDSVLAQLWIDLSDEGISFQFCVTLNHFADSLHQGMNENTTYHFAHDGTCWSIPANFESYEFAYRQQPLSATTDANTPMTIKLMDGHDSLYCYLHELLLEDAPEMTLLRDSVDSLAFHTWLCPDNSGTGTSFNFSAFMGDRFFRSGTRVITFGHKAVDLINSSHPYCSLHLSQLPSTPANKPIKYIGIWWGMHLGINSWVPDARHGATTANALRYIDFAADNNIDAVLFEGWNQGWEQWGGRQEFDFVKAAPDFDVERIIAYAHDKGVEIIMHHETGGNIPHYEAQMEQAFKWCQDHGIHYVKTGYAGGFPQQHLHHSQYGVNHYAKVVGTAQQYGISLDVHEPIKPTGWRVCHPNLMTAEGARGMEWNAWSDGNSPAHTTILPFTRLLAGPMDYTPGIFDITYQRIQHDPNCRQWNMKDARQCSVHTTLAKQVALWVVIYSPMVMAADLIENYEGHPMFQFFRDYNPDCDWSRALQGEPGEYVAIVRRAGSQYFLGAITNEEPRTLAIPLNFLPEGKPYDITLYADAPDADYRTRPTAYQITHHQLTAHDTLTLHLAPGGGCAAVILASE